MKILVLLLVMLAPCLTYAADAQQDGDEVAPSWQRVQEFRSQAEESRRTYISVSAEADGAWELLKSADDHRLTLGLASFSYTPNSGDEALTGEDAVEALIGALLENDHGGQRLFSQMGSLKEFLQGTVDAPFTPKELGAAVTAGIQAGVSVMESAQGEQHGTKELLAAWGCRGPLFYALYKHATRVEEE